jgi:hypothetical protein
MKLLSELTEADYTNLADDVLQLAEQDETELFALIGNGMNNMGLSIADDEQTLFVPVQLRTYKTFTPFSVSYNQQAANTMELGRNFGDQFREKLRRIICDNERLRTIIMGNGTLREKLVLAIPVILSLLGVTALAPPMLAIIAAAIALIVRIGFQAYCDWN